MYYAFIFCLTDVCLILLGGLPSQLLESGKKKKVDSEKQETRTIITFFQVPGAPQMTHASSNKKFLTKKKKKERF